MTVHHIHSVIVSYNRRDLTAETLESYLATVTLPYSLVIVDNGSRRDVQEWLGSLPVRVLLLRVNMYPGYATNRGFDLAPPEATLLHRIDNDTRFLPGWCDDVVEAFKDPGVGQYGLIASGDEETAFWPTWPVGGASIIRRSLWDEGLRYEEIIWTPEASGEDQQLTRDVWARGYTRVFSSRPTMEYLNVTEDGDDYYRQTHEARGL